MDGSAISQPARPDEHARRAQRFAGRLRARRWSTAIVAGMLGVVVLAGGTLRFHAAGERLPRPSGDERSYVRLAADLRHRGTYGDPRLHQPLHWAPGAPVLFAAADALAGRPAGTAIDLRAAVRAQAVVGTLTIVAAFALAALLAGAWAGVAASLVVAVYPPLVDATVALVSEPLGALAITAALATVVWAARGRSAWRFALAGLTLGLACLVRADLALAAAVLPLAVALVVRRDRGWHHGVSRSAAMLLGSAALVVPWCISASSQAGHAVPITDGGADMLFIATYLPGHGTNFGLKHALAPDVRRTHPGYRRVPDGAIPMAAFLDTVAARHPGMSRAAALRAEVLHNLRSYALGSPGAFLAMLGSKLWRMWSEYYHGAVYHPQRAPTLWAHRAIVALALAGLLGALWRVRSPALGVLAVAILATTLLDVVFIAEPRHAFRLLPSLVAGGAAGWALLIGRRARAPAPGKPPAPDVRTRQAPQAG